MGEEELWGEEDDAVLAGEVDPFVGGEEAGGGVFYAAVVGGVGDHEVGFFFF